MAENTSQQSSEKHTAGALDIRNIIGGLIGAYGVILVLMGLFADKQLDKTGDVNANLWAGLAMLVFGASFLLWARLRPIVVPADVPKPDDGLPPGH
jgi:Ca2+/Na+ antiporter